MKTIAWMSLGALLALPAGGVELKLKWQPGKRYIFQQDMSSTMEMAIPGQAEAMVMQTEGVQRLSYTASAHDEGTEVEMAIERFAMTTSMGGQEMMKFDSTDPAAAAGPIGGMLAPLMKARLRTLYDREGTVLEIKGLEEIEGLDQVGMSKDQLTAMAKHAALYLPGKDVEPGDTWSTKVDLPLGELAGQEAAIRYTLKFEGMEEADGKKLARISLSGTLEMAGDGEVVVPMKAKTLAGTILFDVDLGQPLETNLSMDMVMGLPPGTPKAEGAPGEIPMKTATVQKLVAVEEAK